MAKAIHDKDLRLLKVCETTKNYKILMDVVNNYPQITKEDLDSISPDYGRFFKNIYPKVRRELFNEWTGSPDKDIKKFKIEDKKRCYICNSPLQYVCTIHNKLNGKSIDIGIECNKHFKIYKDNDVSAILEKQRMISRMDALDTRYPDILTIITTWKDIIDKENSYIFNSIKERYLDIGEKLVALHKEYTSNKNISNKRELEILDEINILLTEGTKEKEKIFTFLNKNKINILHPTTRMINSLKYKADTIGLNWIEEDMSIKARTLHRFTDSEFCEKLINNFNNALAPKGITVDSFNNSKDFFGYFIVLHRNTDCRLFFPWSEICFLCGHSITGEDSSDSYFTDKDIITDSKLIDEYSIEYGLRIIESFLTSRQIEIEEYYHAYGDVLWKVTKNENSDKPKYYYSTRISKIELLLKNLIYDLDNYTSKKIYTLLLDNSKRLSNGEAYDLIKMRSR